MELGGSTFPFVLVPIGLSILPVGVVRVGVFHTNSHSVMRSGIHMVVDVVHRFNARSSRREDDIIIQASCLILERGFDLAQNNFVVTILVTVMSVDNLDTVSSVDTRLALDIVEILCKNQAGMSSRSSLFIVDERLRRDISLHLSVVPPLGQSSRDFVTAHFSELDSELLESLTKRFQRPSQLNSCHFTFPP